jgi:hypothetical protein
MILDDLGKAKGGDGSHLSKRPKTILSMLKHLRRSQTGSTAG